MGGGANFKNKPRCNQSNVRNIRCKLPKCFQARF